MRPPAGIAIRRAGTNCCSVVRKDLGLGVCFCEAAKIKKMKKPVRAHDSAARALRLVRSQAKNT